MREPLANLGEIHNSVRKVDQIGANDEIRIRFKCAENIALRLRNHKDVCVLHEGLFPVAWGIEFVSWCHVTGNLLSFVQRTHYFAARPFTRPAKYLIKTTSLGVEHHAIPLCRQHILENIAERDRVSAELRVLNLQDDFEDGCKAVLHVLACPIAGVSPLAQTPLNRVAQADGRKELLNRHEHARINATAKQM